jgi:hypothetical protein
MRKHRMEERKKRREQIKAVFVHEVGRRAKLYTTEEHFHFHDFPLETDSDDIFGSEFVCQQCNEKFIPKCIAPKYNTTTGELEAGSMYWNTSLPENFHWDDHKGPHLMVVLPNGHHWCVDSRASNCDMPDDRKHRCWVRHGNPETGDVHVDKRGVTCKAGAGSIKSGNYHGFLHNGYLHR